MSIEDIKTKLSMVRLIEAQIDTILEDLARMREQSIKITSVISDMPRAGGEQDKIGAMMARIVDMEQTLINKVNAKKAVRAEAERLIELLDNPKHKIFLYRWYFLGEKRTDICGDIFYHRRTIYKLRNRLLKEIADKEGTLDNK